MKYIINRIEHSLNFVLSRIKQLRMFHVKHSQLFYYKGFLEGIPAFLGYCLGVFLTFLIFTKDLPISVPGRQKVSVFIIFPPSKKHAVFAERISSLESEDL